MKLWPIEYRRSRHFQEGKGACKNITDEWIDGNENGILLSDGFNENVWSRNDVSNESTNESLGSSLGNKSNSKENGK